MTDEVYFAHDIVTGDKVVVKVEPLDEKVHTLDHEFEVYGKFKQGIGIPRSHWLGTEVGRNVMVIERLGPSLDELFAQCHFRFSLKTVLLLACQLVCNIFLCSYTWVTFISSSVAWNIFTLATSFTTILSQAISSWVLERIRTWFTLSILGYRSNSEIPIHARTSRTAKVIASPERLTSHPSIVTLDWSLADKMIWSRSPTSLFISFMAHYHGRSRAKKSFQ